MTVNNLQFGATVSAWARKSERRMLAIFKASVQQVVSEAQSRVPVDTGFCRASIRASNSSMPQLVVNRPPGDANYTYDSMVVTMVINDVQLGQTLYIGYTANYAIFLEYGHSAQAPSGFVRLAAQQWPTIVRRMTAAARGRVQ